MCLTLWIRDCSFCCLNLSNLSKSEGRLSMNIIQIQFISCYLQRKEWTKIMWEKVSMLCKKSSHCYCCIIRPDGQCALCGSEQNTWTLSQSARPNSSNGGYRARKKIASSMCHIVWKWPHAVSTSTWIFLKVQHASRDWLSFKCLPKPQAAC